MKNYYRIMLGRHSKHADEAHEDNFIGAGWFGNIDLTNKLTEDWRDFNKEMIPVYLEKHPEKSKIAAGLACGMLHTIAKGISTGDIVLCPDGEGNYYVGEVVGDYEYHEEEILPHRRSVRWFDSPIPREDMSEALQNSTGAIGTVSNITKHSEEIERLISGRRPASIISTDKTIEDPSVFALEKHLEEFLVKNWTSTKLSKKYDIYEENGELAGQQYPTDTGSIDILAVSKNKREIVVVELKKGRASDAVVGQVQRYMGYVKDVLAEEGQTVRGIIIAFEDDIKIQRALAVAPNIDFYTYQMHFELKESEQGNK